MKKIVSLFTVLAMMMLMSFTVAFADGTHTISLMDTYGCEVLDYPTSANAGDIVTVYIDYDSNYKFRYLDLFNGSDYYDDSTDFDPATKSVTFTMPDFDVRFRVTCVEKEIWVQTTYVNKDNYGDYGFAYDLSEYCSFDTETHPGDDLYIFVNSTPLLDGGGEFMGFVGLPEFGDSYIMATKISDDIYSISIPEDLDCDEFYLITVFSGGDAKHDISLRYSGCNPTCLSSLLTEGEIAEVYINPNDGYEVDDISIEKNNDDGQVSYSFDGDNTITFTMPDVDVTVFIFCKKSPTYTVAKGTESGAPADAQALKYKDNATVRFIWNLTYNETAPEKLGAYIFNWSVFEDGLDKERSAKITLTNPEISSGQYFFGDLENIPASQYNETLHAIPFVNDTIFADKQIDCTVNSVSLN